MLAIIFTAQKGRIQALEGNTSQLQGSYRAKEMLAQAFTTALTMNIARLMSRADGVCFLAHG